MSDLAELRREAAGCTACELYADATQTVFGSGPQRGPKDRQTEMFDALVADLALAGRYQPGANAQRRTRAGEAEG